MKISGSPSFARTWLQKEPKQCLYVGFDTDKGDADRPNYRSRLVVREIKKAMKKSDVPFAAELFSGMPLLESVKALFSLWSSPTVRKRRVASEFLRCTTSAVRTSMEYPCDECLWNSVTRRKRGSHVRTDLSWNTLAC